MKASVMVWMLLLSQQARAQPADEPPQETELPAIDPSPPQPPPAQLPATPPPVVLHPPPPPALAVVQPQAPPPHQRPICATGRPRPFCRTVFLLEYAIRGGTSTTIAFDIGLLANLGARNAIGATIGGFGYEHRLALMTVRDSSIAYKLRYRRWLTNNSELDLGVGAGKFGGVVEVAIGYKDLIALTGGVNTFPVEFGRGAAANVGVRLGSTGLLYLLYGVAILAGGR